MHQNALRFQSRTAEKRLRLGTYKLLSILLIGLYTVVAQATGDGQHPYRPVPPAARAFNRARRFRDIADELRHITIKIKNVAPPTDYNISLVAVGMGNSFQEQDHEAHRTASGRPLITIRLSNTDLRSFDNEDQMVGYALFHALTQVLAERVASVNPKEPSFKWSDKENNNEFSKLDIETMDTMFNLGYDPREFRKWFLNEIDPKKTEGRASLLGINHFFRIKSYFPDPNIRPVLMNHWLREQTGKRDFPNPRPLPKDVEKIAHPERALQFSNQGLIDYLMADPDFQAISHGRRIHILHNIAIPYFDKNWIQELEPFTDSPFLINDQISDDVIVRIDALIERIAIESAAADAKIEAFHYFLDRNFKRRLSPDKLLKLFDKISPRPAISTLAEYKTLTTGQQGFHAIQKLRMLFDIALASSDISEWQTIEDAVVELTTSKNRLPTDIRPWIAKHFEAPLLKKLDQLNATEAAKEELRQKLSLVDTSLKALLKSEVNALSKLLGLEKEYLSQHGPSGLSAMLNKVKVGSVALAAVPLGAAALAIHKSWEFSQMLYSGFASATGIHREITPIKPDALPQTVAKRIEHLISLAETTSDTAAIYEIFKEIQYIYISDFGHVSSNHAQTNRQLVSENLRQKFIEAVYYEGTFEEMAGLRWPAIFRGKTLRDGPGTENILVSIQRFLQSHASEIPGEKLVPVLNIIYLHLFSSDGYQEMGLTTEHCLEFIRAQNAKLSPTARIKALLKNWKENETFLSAFFPKIYVATDFITMAKSPIWPIESERLFRRIFREVQREIEESSYDPQIIDSTMDILNVWSRNYHSKNRHQLSQILNQALEGLRYRPLPQTIGDIDAHFDELTNEEIDSSLAAILKKASSLSDHSQLMKLIRKFNDRLSSNNRFYSALFTDYFKEIYNDHLELFYKSAIADNEPGIINGDYWPKLLPSPRAPSAAMIQLYKKLKTNFQGSPYERFQLLAPLTDAGKNLDMSRSELLAVLEDSPHYKALPPHSQLKLLETLVIQRDEKQVIVDVHFDHIYSFLNTFRNSKLVLPQELLDLITDDKIPCVEGIDFLDYSLIQKEKEQPQHTMDFIAAMVVRSRLKDQSSGDFALNGRAAVLISHTVKDHVKARNLIRQFRSTQIPQTISELQWARGNSELVGDLSASELDLALQHSLRHAQGLQDYPPHFTFTGHSSPKS